MIIDVDREKEILIQKLQEAIAHFEKVTELEIYKVKMKYPSYPPHAFIVKHQGEE